MRLKETQPPPHRGWHKSAGRHSPSIVHESSLPCQQGVVAASRSSTSHVAADKGHWPQQSSSSPLRPLKGSRRFVRRPRCCAQRKSIVEENFLSSGRLGWGSHSQAEMNTSPASSRPARLLKMSVTQISSKHRAEEALRTCLEDNGGKLKASSPCSTELIPVDASRGILSASTSCQRGLMYRDSKQLTDRRRQEAYHNCAQRKHASTEACPRTANKEANAALKRSSLIGGARCLAGGGCGPVFSCQEAFVAPSAPTSTKNLSARRQLDAYQ